MSIGAALTFSPLGELLVKAAAPPPTYRLPFPGGIVWRVGLAVNGGRSHAGRAAYAWDFGMPSGSPRNGLGPWTSARWGSHSTTRAPMPISRSTQNSRLSYIFS